MANNGSPKLRYDRQKLEPAMDPKDTLRISGRFPALVNLPVGAVVGELTAQPGHYNLYAAGNSDGTQVAVGVLEYRVETDATGCIIKRLGVFPDVQHTSPIYVKGFFRTNQLTGLDTNAASQMGRLIQGTVATGIISIN